MIKRFLALALLCLGALAARADVTTIDSAELARLAASGVPVIDIRTAGEWTSTGVIPGSKLITYFDENGRSDPPRWLDKVKAVAPAQPVIVICRSGKRSAAATQFLARQAGYTTVYNVERGLNAWLGEGRPTVAPSSAALAACAPGARC